MKFLWKELNEIQETQYNCLEELQNEFYEKFIIIESSERILDILKNTEYKKEEDKNVDLEKIENIYLEDIENINKLITSINCQIKFFIKEWFEDESLNELKLYEKK